MYRDNFLILSSAQALTATAVATNVVDLSLARSVGNGEPVAVVFSVGVAADVADGSEDYTFDLKYASNAALTAGEQLMSRRVFESGTPTAPAQDADLLAAGYTFAMVLPPATASDDGRYLGVEYTLAGTTPSITVDCWIAPVKDISIYIPYADNITIS